MDTNTLREKFLDYFKKHGHAIVPSSSLIPENDPTILFTNAGMNQFKEVFLGVEKRAYTRATSSQCCMRVSGKHNDLENVGYTARHHTFFEMLGNFSFGDYFKDEAIRYAWEFLTKELKISPEKLWVTVYKDDKESEDIWIKKIGVDPKRFSRCGEKDNFWSMGDTGPCGPCTEIFYDHGSEIAGGPPGSEDAEGDRYIEIWNLVFMQYNRGTDGKMQLLPRPSVDTGMGLERIAAVMQGVHDNYDIDIFVYLINEISKILNVKDKSSKAVRVIADHIRAAAFLIADGVIPSNEGRGYVLRRVIRRAIRHAHKLGATDPFFYKLVASLVKIMGDAYPKLVREAKLIERVLHQEEEQFATTLDQGLKILEQELSNLTGKVIPGQIVFRLYDTYGFPVDLTADIARENGFTIDLKGFEESMALQKASSKKASKFIIDYSKALKMEGTTDFVGYKDIETSGKIIFLIKDNEQQHELHTGQEGIIILDRTPFYAESGGQIGDVGDIVGDDFHFVVTDTQKQGVLFLHYGKMVAGNAKLSAKVTAKVDTKRQAVMLNHTATHLLHAALREVLGVHIEQKGSLVQAERLRFDFSHFEAMTASQLKTVETLVNRHIRTNLAVRVEELSIDEAKKKGAMALFGEKYGDIVRVVTIGGYSMELCGGTHVKATGEIGLFKIISETGIAAGIRRIEAITGEVAFNYLETLENSIRDISYLLKTNRDNLLVRLEQTLTTCQNQEKELQKLKQEFAKTAADDLLQKATTVKNIKILAATVENTDIKTMRDTIDQLRDKLGSSVVLLATVLDNKVHLVAGVSRDCVDRVHAGKLVQFVANQLGGKGGGRADLAQGAGNDISGLNNVLATVVNWIDENLA